MTPRSAADAAQAYFAAVNARDAAAMREVFAPQGELVTPAGRVVGPDQIAAFYTRQAFAAEDLEAHPGPLLVDGNRVAVEIELHMHGQRTRVADFFEVRDGLIQRLAVYLAGPA
ncbi:MAG: nuclear transport factor 2 family protein [Candidatus Binatia bacterium]